VSKLFALEPLGLALSEKQIPQIVETIRSVENYKRLWKPSGCAQGRCATRLRYAPTCGALLILNHFLLRRGKTVTKLHQLVLSVPEPSGPSFAFGLIFCNVSRFICNFICEYFLKTFASPCRSKRVTPRLSESRRSSADCRS
jgi:hypothetical protein